jgi:uncharacterized protein YqgV (UPF0045/DUF77 family)
MGRYNTEKLLRRVIHPMTTIFENHLDRWMEERIGDVVESITRRIPERLEETDRSRSIYYQIDEEVDRLARHMVKYLERNLTADSKYVAIAEGEPVEGKETYCVIFELREFFDDIANAIYEKALDKIYSEDWEEETARTTRKKKVKLDPFHSFWEGYERYLTRCIPVIFKDEVLEYIDGVSENIANAIRTQSNEMDEFDAYHQIRDEAEEYVKEIEEELDKWGCPYVNIVSGSFDIGSRASCKIISDGNFCSKLVGAIVNRTLKLLGITDEEYYYKNVAEDYFETEF